MYPPAREELARHGISCSGHRARQVRKSDYENFDLIKELKAEQIYVNPIKKDLDRLDLIDKMISLENELKDMRKSIEEDVRISSSNDEEMNRLNKKVNDLRAQIIEIMNKDNNEE